MNKNLKTLLFTFFYSVGLLVAQAQDFYVLQVTGTVKTPSGNVIKTSDQLKASDKLIFSSSKDAVAVVSAKNGRFIIKPEAGPKDNEFIALVKDAVVPGIKKLSTRAGGINNVVDFQVYLQDVVLLLDTMRLKVSPAAFPMNNEAFFFIRYQYNEEAINKKLPFNGNQVLIAREELFSIDGQRIDHEQATDLQLYYITGNKPQPISPIQLSIPDLETLREEAEVLKTSLDESKYNVQEEVFLYLTEIYGKLTLEDFERWYKNQML